MKNLLSITALILLGAVAGNAQGIFSADNPPNLPGERQLSIEIELGSLQPNQMIVNCIYSTDSMVVVNALNLRTKTGREPSAKAKIRALGNGKVLASIILPHYHHREPNSQDRNPKVINQASKVYYAWEREGVTPTAVKSFVLPRLLIIAYMGDSYASGEGAPNTLSSIGNPSDWTEDDCHRSEKSGGMLAIKKLIREHPEWGIRYINTTCSGATLADFTSADERTSLIPSGNWTKPPQFKQIQDWMERKNRKVVDILLTDGGGNDVGFGPIAISVLSAFFGDISKDEEKKEAFRVAMGNLAARYDDINNKIQSEFYGFEVGRVIWFNYPNPMTAANGNLCSPLINGVNPVDCWGPSEMQINNADMLYIRDVVFNGMNAEVKKAVDKHGWDFVDVSNRALRHGLCNCEEPYFNTLGQSIGIQGDPMGTIHPNATGFRKIYLDPLFTQLERSIDLWHTELKKDARAIAMARAKAKARAEAERQAILAEINRINQLTNKKISAQKVIIPATTREKIKIAPEDQQPAQPDNGSDD